MTWNNPSKTGGNENIDDRFLENLFFASSSLDVSWSFEECFIAN